MVRFHITTGNIKRYNAAFHDDVCQQCNDPIEEGDPIGFIIEDASRHKSKAAQFGPLCDRCLYEHGTPTYIEKK